MSEGLRAAGRKAIKKSKKKAGPIESQPGGGYIQKGEEASSRRRGSVQDAAAASAERTGKANWRTAVKKVEAAGRFRGNWVPEIQKKHQVSYLVRTGCTFCAGAARVTAALSRLLRAAAVAPRGAHSCRCSPLHSPSRRR